MWTVGSLLIVVVILAACIGVVMVATKQFGIVIPDWIIKILWIVLVAVVAVVAIRFLLSL